MKATVYLFYVSIVLLSACNNKADTLFRLLPPDESGISFNNRVVESDSLNMLDYEYTYNGGGVAVADFNNDGLQDLYFAGNIVKNKLYLNRGNLQFRDITRAAGVGSTGEWHAGVSAVDINSDGRMDLHLSITRNENPDHRKNILYINQGLNDQDIPVFENRAEAYGLATTSFSTQAAFFDYDNDGDLDMYELVADKRRKGRREELNNAEIQEDNTDNLFRNDWDSTHGHPYYTEVSRQAGITKAGYGLGFNVVDINRDGWKDIYVSNDYASNDLFWINQGDGRFMDKAGDYFKHTSFSGMGTDVGDINNDGLMDIFTLDMAGSNNFQKQRMYSPNNYRNYFNEAFKQLDPQYTRNTLQLNQGDIPEVKQPIFSEIALLSGVSQTDWSWGALIADFDNDTFNDIVITNGIPRLKIDKDFVRFRDQVSNVAPTSMLLDSIPRNKSTNVSYENNGDLTFDNSSRKWGLDAKAYSTGVAWGDLDNDGDLDLVMNNINDPAFVYENTLDKRQPTQHWLKVSIEGSEQNSQGLGAEVTVYSNGKRLVREHNPYRGYLSTVQNVVHFGVGEAEKLDSVTVRWNNRKQQTWSGIKTDQTISARYDQGSNILEEDIDTHNPLFEEITDVKNVDFKHQELPYIDFRKQRLLPYQLSRYGPPLAVGDADGNNYQDLYIGGSQTYPGTILLQNSDGSFRRRLLQPRGETSDIRYEDSGALFFDADNDGDQDLYVVSGSVELPANHAAYQDRLYENDGTGRFVYNSDALPQFEISGLAVKGADYDQDGDLDLFVAGHTVPQFYPLPASGYILRNDSKSGNIQFTDVTSSAAPILKDIGMVTDALWTDFNNDNRPDLLLTGHWMPLTFLQNEGSTFREVTRQTGIGDKVGWWNSLAGGDFDNDGDMDYVAGNTGLNTIYKASDSHPVSVYADDFDRNGVFEAVLTYFNPDSTGKLREYPVHNYEDFRWQLPRKIQQLPDVRSYAVSDVRDLFEEKELENASVYRANEMRSAFIENEGNGAFHMIPLPTEAQFAPVYGMVAEDFTRDGITDVLLSGNFFGVEVQVGNYDALNGLLLKGQGNGSFTPAGMKESGIYIPGDGKALVKLKSSEGKYMVAASQNRDSLKLFRHQAPTKVLNAEPMDAYAVIKLENGSRKKNEFYYGSSFQSASGRFLILPPNTVSVTVVDYSGNRRKVPLAE